MKNLTNEFKKYKWSGRNIPATKQEKEELKELYEICSNLPSITN